MKIKTMALAFLTLIQGCSTVDDYLLGKDNTPKPAEMTQIKSKIKLTRNWSVAIGKPHKTQDYLKIKPIIINHKVYIANTGGVIQEMDANNGKVNWASPLKQPIVSGPTVGEGHIAVGTSGSTVAVLTQSNGQELWQNKVSGEVLSPPAIAHNKVIVKTIDGKVYAFDLNTGKQLWIADHGSPSLVLRASSTPVVLGNLVLIGFSDGKMDAMDLSTGRVVWQRSLAYASGASDVERLVDIDSDPIVRNNIAYLGSYQGYIGALSLNDGQFLWNKPGSVYKNMILRSNTLYLTDSDDVVWALNASTGTANWQQNALKARGLIEPVMIGNSLVVGDKSGYLHVMDTKTGELIGRIQLSGGITLPPSVNGKMLYVQTDNGMLNQLTVG